MIHDSVNASTLALGEVAMGKKFPVWNFLAWQLLGISTKDDAIPLVLIG